MCSEKLRNLFYLLFFLLPGILWTQNIWHSEQITNSRNLIECFLDIAIGPDGTIHTVYQQDESNKRPSPGDVLYQNKKNDIWSDPINLGLTGYYDFYPAMDVDGNGIAHVIFSRTDPQIELSGQLYYWNSSEGFGDPIEIVKDLDVAISIELQDISVDDNDYLHIVFLGWQAGSLNEAYYTNNFGTGFMTPVMIEPVSGNDVINFPRIDADENGKVGVTFGRRENQTDEKMKIYYTSNASGAFIPPVLLSNPEPDIHSNTSEVIVSNGAAYIIFMQDNPVVNSLKDVYYTKLDEATGSYILPPQIVIFTTSLFGASMDFQSPDGISPGKVHISFEDYKEIVKPKGSYWQPLLKYMVLNADDGSEINGEEIVYDDDGGGGNRISLDPDNNAHIVFGAHRDIFYATNAVTAAGVMHIAGVNVLTKTKGKNVNGVANVAIVDEFHNPVEGASVSGTWSGMTSDSDVFQTGADGSGSCSSDKVDKNSSGYFTFTVTNVSKDGWAYDPSANVEDSDSAPWNTGFAKPTSDISQTFLPQTTELLGNYPNPFNPVTRIAYQIAQIQYVEITIFNINGQLIRRLVKAQQDPGFYSTEWDGRDDSGRKVASGIYIYKLNSRDLASTRQMVLMR